MIGIEKISNKPIWSYIKAQKCLREGDADALIVCKNNSSFGFCSEYFPNDIKNKCFIVDADTKREGTYKLIPIHSYRRLSDLQFMISPKCNLNCKLCSHFSPLAYGCTNYDFEMFYNDILRIKKFVDVIDSIDLWGEKLCCAKIYIDISIRSEKSSEQFYTYRNKWTSPKEHRQFFNTSNERDTLNILYQFISCFG